jgi:ATP-binding cassette subfamily C protein
VFAREALRALQEPVVGTLLALGLFSALRIFAIPLSSTLVLGLVFTRALTRVASIQGKYQAMLSETSALWAIDAAIREAEDAREPSGGARRVGPRARDHRRARRARARRARALRRSLARDPVGRIVAVIGASGIGKTTLTDLLTGLVLADRRRVRVDGVPLAELDLPAWRRQVGYVPQDLPMLHDTVRRNVTLGDPSLDDAAVEAALRAPARGSSCARCRAGSTRASASAARSCRAVSASASRSRARSCTSRDS